MNHADSPGDSLWLRRALAVSIGLNAALLIACAYAVLTRGDRVENLQRYLDEPEIRERVVSELVAEAGGFWDTHNDPDVGRVLQPEIEKDGGEPEPVRSNEYGMRERSYEMPKPDDLVRVVFLGDSLVFGSGITTVERSGVLLQDALRERNGNDDLRVEALNLGLSSWNILAECAWLRRQLGILRPDLVVHVTTVNDLDDMTGVRGYGGMSRFCPRLRERADSRVTIGHGMTTTGRFSQNPLLHAVDHESRERYREAREAIERLAAAVEQQGGRYLMALHWQTATSMVREHLTGGLREDQLLYLSPEYTKDPQTWVSDENRHWNYEGMRILSQLTYGLIIRRDLLPTLSLPPWDEAEEAVRAFHDPVVDDPTGVSPRSDLSELIESSIVLVPLTLRHAAHVYGGIDAEGLVAPYASLVLANRPAGRLRLQGSPLGRVELQDVQVEVFADEHVVGTFQVGLDEPIDVSWDLPDEVRDREHLAIRLRSDDYGYAGEHLQHCVVFRLERVSIESGTGD